MRGEKNDKRRQQPSVMSEQSDRGTLILTVREEKMLHASRLVTTNSCITGRKILLFCLKLVWYQSISLLTDVSGSFLSPLLGEFLSLLWGHRICRGKENVKFIRWFFLFKPAITDVVVSFEIGQLLHISDLEDDSNLSQISLSGTYARPLQSESVEVVRGFLPLEVF